MRIEFVVNFQSVEKAFSKARYQRYIIDVNLFSKAIMMESVPHLKFFRILDMPTVHVKIDYVDYVFAKKVLKIIEEWVENLPQIESRWHFPKLQELSLHYWWILGNWVP